jgi:uncharacterized protein YqjF (DUF2071 family)
MALVSDAAHPRWPLRRGRVTKLAQTHLECAGLPAPGGPPIVHFSDGVDVRIGPPRPVRP